MAELKTKENDQSVIAFLEAVTPEKRKTECFEVLELMREITGSEPRMWGTSIVGFGQYDYHYASGRTGTWFQAGFAPRKQALTLYIMSGFSRYQIILERLGSYKTGKSCLYLKSLDQVDREVLRELILASVEHISKKSPREC